MSYSRVLHRSHSHNPARERVRYPTDLCNCLLPRPLNDLTHLDTAFETQQPRDPSVISISKFRAKDSGLGNRHDPLPHATRALMREISVEHPPGLQNHSVNVLIGMIGPSSQVIVASAETRQVLRIQGSRSKGRRSHSQVLKNREHVLGFE